MLCVWVDVGEAAGDNIIVPEAILLLPSSSLNLTLDPAVFIVVSRLIFRHCPASFSWLSLVILKTECVVPFTVVVVGEPKTEQSVE